MSTERKRRANGEESRRRILDAAAEVAGERGYDGTSIAQVSARCGLPVSSIYWHFKDKDELIAAVIERSFEQWLTAFDAEGEDVPELVVRIGEALVATPDFLRLGLMLALERRPHEASARRMFLQVRATTLERIASTIREHAPSWATRPYDCWRCTRWPRWTGSSWPTRSAGIRSIWAHCSRCTGECSWTPPATCLPRMATWI
ncbi:TetR/AcrR family transcriptional regulator [Kutzneria kofuensis]|uniref:TetR/AcrR family transcriptional regulator n=1 Tax=Kutzneria kofuensis TaxID=103725 RepID=UPI0031E64913